MTTIPPTANLTIASLGACLATACVHPLDVVRLRRQVGGGSTSTKATLRTTAPWTWTWVRGMYAGLSAGLLRQLFYGTSRFGFFNVFQDALLREKRKEKLSASENLACALAAGGLAGVVGNPADVALTRMAADAKAPPELRRNYRHGFHAIATCFREEGVRGLMQGVGPNVARALMVNGVMLTSYAETKKLVADVTGLHHQSAATQFLAGNVAGFNTALICMPVDVLKTRLQYARPGQFAGVRDAARTVWREGGVPAFWVGFVPLWLKLAPHTTITMMIVERLRQAYVTFVASQY